MIRNKEVRFKNAASLFKFCKMVIEHKYPIRRVKDQDVGFLLKLDPATTSHWKTGKRQMDSLSVLNNLSSSLEVSKYVIYSLVDGEVNESEAFSMVFGRNYSKK